MSLTRIDIHIVIIGRARRKVEIRGSRELLGIAAHRERCGCTARCHRVAVCVSTISITRAVRRGVQCAEIGRRIRLVDVKESAFIAPSQLEVLIIVDSTRVVTGVRRAGVLADADGVVS